MRKLTKAVSALLTVVLLLSVVLCAPFTVSAAVNDSDFANAISNLKKTFVDGQYWNKYNSSDYSHTGTIPCKGSSGGVSCISRGYCGYNGYCTCLCGAYVYGGVEKAWQCLGFACKLGYSIFGTDPYSWSKHTNASNLKPGDIVYGNLRSVMSGATTHAIFITGVSGSNVTYADCNSAGPCKVKWERTTTVSAIQSSINNSSKSGMYGYISHASNNSTSSGTVSHTHNFNTYVYNWTSHPHYKCYKCSCGEVKENRNQTTYVDTCPECNKVINNELPIDLGDQFYALIKNKKTGNFISESDKINEYANDVIGMPANGEKAQTWLFNKNYDGSYSIKNLASNMYLDVNAGDNLNNLTAQPNGTNIETYYKYGGSGNQRFFIYRLFNSYYIRPAGMFRMVDMGISNGLVAVWDYGENFDPQKFDIIRLDLNNEFPVNLGDQFSAIIKNQKTGNLITETDKISELAYDVMGIPANGEQTQTWFFNRNNDGSYSIKNLASNMYLDVCAGDNINNLTAQPNGTNIITYYKYNGTGNQKFFIYRLFDSYYIKPVGMNRIFDMGISNGLVAVWDYGENFDPQKFDIIKIEENIIGDVNSDGEVSILDATELQKYLAELTYLNDEQLAVADANGDGEISILDATEIQKYLAEMIPSLG